MKSLRRAAQGIVVFILCAVLLCGDAFADVTGSPFPDVPANADYVEAAAALAAIGIFTGDEAGNFNPDKTISRAEAAAVICRMMGIEDEAKQLKKVVFNDVPASHWAVGYVAKASELGVIGGYGNGKFGPSNPVTYEQMLKMLLNIWGYEDIAKEYQQTGGTWSSGYLRIAEDLEITLDIRFTPSAAAPRSAVALLCYRTLNTEPYNNLWGNF